MDKHRESNLWRPAGIAVLLLTAAALIQLTLPVIRSGAIRTSWKWQLVAALGILALIAEFGLILFAESRMARRAPAALDRLVAVLAARRPLAVALWTLALLLYPSLILGPTGRYLSGLTVRLLIFALLCALGSLLLKSIRREDSGYVLLAFTALAFAALYRMAAYIPDISSYPLSMGWSETSRFYYASLFFSEKIYGLQTPPSVLHPSRYLLQSIPFLLPSAPLWLHRAWQVSLWIGNALAAGFLIRQRFAISGRMLRWLALFWIFLNLLFAPVLYHLLISVILVLWGFDSRRPWRSLFVVVLASLWAGISRINWVPVPGFIAATLYFLEIPTRGRPVIRYLLPPALWIGTGAAAALLAQTGYVLLSGNSVDRFSSSFTSDLLWYRLLPSATYPLGVLPAILLAAGPVALVMAARLRGRMRSYHPIRQFGLASMLFVLFAGGVVVSAKIGGGSNLHNMDAFLILLALIGGKLYFHGFEPDRTPPQPPAPIRWPVHAALILISVVFTLQSGGPLPARDFVGARALIETIRAHIAQASLQGGDILLISERHLLTFGEIQPVLLVPEYEKVFLMEMARAGNPDYLGALREDLRTHRYSLIVSHPQRIRYQGRGHPFGEENDAWVRGVAEPILCYYEPILTAAAFSVQLLAPRSEPGACGG